MLMDEIYFQDCWKVESLLIMMNCFVELLTTDPANSDLLKVNNKNTRKRSEIFSKLTIKTPE